jgi:hypothetical protein
VGACRAAAWGTPDDDDGGGDDDDDEAEAADKDDGDNGDATASKASTTGMPNFGPQSKASSSNVTVALALSSVTAIRVCRRRTA